MNFMNIDVGFQHIVDQHEHHEFVQCMGNDGVQWIQERRYDFKLGRTFFIPAGVKHQAIGTDKHPARLRFIAFNDSEVIEYMGKAQLQLIESIRQHKAYAADSENELSHRLFEQLQALKSSSSNTRDHHMGSLTTQAILAHLGDHRRHAPEHQEIAHGLEACHQQIMEQPEKDWTLEDCARQANMSRSVFARKFKASFGQSLIQNITDQRMRKAAYLLDSSEQSILDIADRCGYKSLSNFYNHFSKHLGLSPKAYRKQQHLERQKQAP